MCQISKLYNIATVQLQICNGTNKCGKIFYCFIFFFSLLSLHFFFSLLSHSLVPSLLPQTPILSFQNSVCLSISHSLFLSASSPCSTSAPPCSPRHWRSLPRSLPSEIRSRGSSCSPFLLRPWLIALAFNTIGWIDWAKAAIVPGLVSLIVGVICNGVRRGAVVV